MEFNEEVLKFGSSEMDREGFWEMIETEAEIKGKKRVGSNNRIGKLKY